MVYGLTEKQQWEHTCEFSTETNFLDLSVSPDNCVLQASNKSDTVGAERSSLDPVL